MTESISESFISSKLVLRKMLPKELALGARVSSPLYNGLVQVKVLCSVKVTVAPSAVIDAGKFEVETGSKLEEDDAGKCEAEKGGKLEEDAAMMAVVVSVCAMLGLVCSGKSVNSEQNTTVMLSCSFQILRFTLITKTCHLQSIAAICVLIVLSDP